MSSNRVNLLFSSSVFSSSSQCVLHLCVYVVCVCDTVYCCFPQNSQMAANIFSRFLKSSSSTTEQYILLACRQTCILIICFTTRIFVFHVKKKPPNRLLLFFLYVFQSCFQTLLWFIVAESRRQQKNTFLRITWAWINKLNFFNWIC